MLKNLETGAHCLADRGKSARDVLRLEPLILDDDNFRIIINSIICIQFLTFVKTLSCR